MGIGEGIVHSLNVVILPKAVAPATIIGVDPDEAAEGAAGVSHV